MSNEGCKLAAAAAMEGIIYPESIAFKGLVLI